MQSIRILVLLLFFSQVAFANKKKEIKVGYFIAPTFIFENEKKEAAGPVYEFFKSIERISDYQFKFELYTNSRLYREIELGRVDMMAMSAKQLENKYIVTNNTPLFIDKPYLIARKEFKLDKITNVSQLSKYTIGIKKDGAISPFLLENKNRLKFEESSATDSVYLLLLKLLGNRVDLIHGYSSHIYIYLAKKNKVSDKIKLVEIPGEYSKIYTGFSSKLNKNDRNNINKLIDHLLTEEKINLTAQIKNWED